MIQEVKITLPAVSSGWSTTSYTWPNAYRHSPLYSADFIGNLYNNSSRAIVLISESATGFTLGIYQNSGNSDILVRAIGFIS